MFVFFYYVLTYLLNFLILDWDGKMLPELTGHEQVERLPIIISHSEGEQLLGVPKLSVSTGLEMSNAIFNLLTEWKIDDQIVAACFDTTASNSGRLNGAAVLLEQLLGRGLLYLPCITLVKYFYVLHLNRVLELHQAQMFPFL